MMDFLFENTVTLTIIQLFAGCFGSIAFSILYGVPRKYYAVGGLVGGIGWAAYFVLDYLDLASVTVATFIATLLVAFLSRLCAVWQKCPVTIFLIAGIFPLVPGAGIYWTVYYLVMGNQAEAGARGFTAFKLVMAIVIGIVMVLDIPNKFFRMMSKEKREEDRRGRV